MRMTAVSTLILCCGAAMAQDSTSMHQGLPGDAPESYTASEQCANYVVTLAPIMSSWGNEWAIAPIVKATGADQGNFFNNLTSAQSISATYAPGASGGDYYTWMDAPGQGANPQDNTTTGTVTFNANNPLQLAAAMSEFGGNYAGLTAGIINIDPSNPSDLYVRRIVAASNGASASVSSGAFGFGGIDSSGNMHFRTDGNGSVGANAFTANNWFHVNLLSRTCGQLNVLDNTGASDTGTRLITNSSTNYSPPSSVPETLAGRPMVIGATFATTYAYESAPGVITETTSHRPGTGDHRGRTNFSPSTFFGGIGTSSVIAYIGGDAIGFSAFGVASDGAPLAAETHELPTASGGTITDNFDGFFITESGNIRYEYDHYHSQTGFSGGANFGINNDRDGNLLVAGTVYDTGTGGTGSNPINYIVATRLDSPGDTSPEWTLVAYNNFPNGKAITDGAGNVIGQLVELNQVSPTAPFGPSMSSPAMDSEGNVWFLSSVEVFDPNGGASNFGTGLIRAVYDAATFSYELELVFDTGDVITGVNSGTNYQIRFLSLADSNSVDSGTLWANNIVHEPWLNQAPATSDDPAAMGGLVIAARIVYDVNGDGFYDTDPSFGDEDYRALLFLAPGAQPCPPDLTGDGMVNTNDFFQFLAYYQVMDLRADFFADGMINTNDFFAYLAAYQQYFLTGCP